MKEPLARRLTRDSIAADEKEAAALIMSGRVYVNGQTARAGQLLRPDDRLQVRGLKDRYLAKGGLKLEGAIRDFAIQAEGRVCIDAGASTGGFTDCLLKHGAGRVYAVDAGYGQLHGTLRQDPRVVNMERTNIGDAILRGLDPCPTLGSCDLSYLSLRKAVPMFFEAMQGQGELLCLVKPLFETSDAQARRSGEIPDEAYEPLLEALIGDLDALLNTRVRGLTNSPVRGNTGTREFFLHLAFGGQAQGATPDRGCIARCVQRALALAPYAKSGLVDAG